MNTIYFNSKINEFRWLSNFYGCNIYLDGEIWPTVEHYFQSQKFVDKDYAEKIRNAATAGQAKKLGRSRNFSINEDWDSRRVDVMRTALNIKFLKNEYLKEKLLETKEANLVEKSLSDYFWGNGRAGTGKNMLGILIMELRDSIIKNS